ncbi:MAG: hypothetical protein IT303_20425 [Dehalococcoidia bacterium]|nr:hypothetical protein [Dehalococcoidia bacterium]
MVSSLDAGIEGAPDDVHLTFAAATGLVLVSSNIRDFPRIHAEWLGAGRSHSGIIIIVQQKFGVGEQLRRLERIAGTIGQAGMVDRLEYLSSWG